MEVLPTAIYQNTSFDSSKTTTKTTTISLPLNYTEFICPIEKVEVPFEFVQSNLCDPGWAYFEHTNKCYRVVTKNMNQPEAIETCNTLNATLASIHGRLHNDFLLKLTRSLPEANQTFFAFWIGLVQLDRSYDWTFGWNWLDGSVVDFLGWTRLMPKARSIVDSKDSYTYNQDPGCAILVANATNEVYRINGLYYFFDFTSFWVDVDLIQKSCNSIFSGVICQKDSIYVIYNPNKMVWQEAADACASMNASLATIENQDEHAFLIRDLIQPANTLPAYTFWLERITDDCNYQVLNWQSIDGPAALAADGIGFSLVRYHGMFVEFCEYPSVGAVCKRKPSKDPLVKAKNIINENVKIPVQSEGYSAIYKSTLSPEESGCFVYAAISKGKLCRWCDRAYIDDCYGCSDPDTTKDRVGTNNTLYIKVDKVGCRDCLSLINLKCPKDDFCWPSIVTFAPPLTNLTIITRSYSKYVVWNFANSAPNVENTWVPYIIHPRILNAKFASDAFKDIIYECTFYWDAFQDALHLEIFNSVRKSRLERQIEYALRTGNYTNLGGDCTRKNYDRYQGLNLDLHEKLLRGIVAFDTLRQVNIGLIILNFGNLATFVILFIPHMVYAIGCNYDRWHCITGGDNDLVTLIYHISILLFLHNSRVAIWRFFDG
uniref:C-type lectin domain-containing protein n=1 Tax=Acrobeloides nanus TaxID=290746 RepID=A0A914C7P6_9BILA